MAFFDTIKNLFSSRKSTPFEQSAVSNSYQIKYVNLRDYGFTEAGRCGGDTINYGQYLDDIAYKRLIDITLQDKSDENEKRNIQNKIDIEKLKITDLENDIRGLKDKNKEAEEEITRLQNNIQKYITGELPLPFEGGRFDIVRFTFLSFLLFVSSLALYLFYCGVIFKGLLISVPDLAKGIKQGIYADAPLPNTFELVIFFTQYTPYIILPIIFFVFGYLLDIILQEKNSSRRNIKITLIILITIILDIFLAYAVQQNLASANKILKRGYVLDFSQDPNFYLALFFGFISFIFWSAMMYYWNKERAKKHIFARIEEAINNLKKLISGRRDEIRGKESEIQRLNQQISNLETEKNRPSIDNNDVRSAITNFSVGWFNYLSNIPNREEKMNECERIKNAKFATI